MAYRIEDIFESRAKTCFKTNRNVRIFPENDVKSLLERFGYSYNHYRKVYTASNVLTEKQPFDYKSKHDFVQMVYGFIVASGDEINRHEIHDLMFTITNEIEYIKLINVTLQKDLERLTK
jgi:hypothetical protein